MPRRFIRRGIKVTEDCRKTVLRNFWQSLGLKSEFGDNMMRPRMILTDLDGTLLRDDKSVSPATMAAMRRAGGAGAEVVLATGRFFAGIPQELRDLPFLRYFILMNGAKIYDRQEDRTVYRAEISLEEGEKIFDLIQPLDAMVDCYQNDMGLIDQKYYQRLDYYVTDPASRTIVKNSRTPQEHFREAVRQGGTIQKIQCFFPHLELRPGVMQKLEEQFPHLNLSCSLPANLEINAPGATKGDALTELCRMLDIPVEETAAFGDGTNDLSMIRTAGTGVAMANGDAAVLAAANLTAPTNQEDGVARVLGRWF